MARISVLVADDSVIVREGLRALLALADDIEVVGVASDYHELVTRAEELAPQVIVTDIRMPPTFQLEGLEGARAARKRHPGTGIVILSQYDDPEYAISLLSEGAAGCAYLLKDRVAEGDQLAGAIRGVVNGASILDAKIVEALLRPVDATGLTASEQELLKMVADGRTIQAIAATRHTTAASVAGSIEQLFLTLARAATVGGQGALRNLRSLHQAIVEREEQGLVLSRMLPGGIAARLKSGDGRLRHADRLVVTVLMSDVRGFSTIAETSDPSSLAAQVSAHRAAVSQAILAEGGTVMQFVGDAVMAVFGAPEPQLGHASHALRSACAVHVAQEGLNRRWAASGLPVFRLGIGLSTGLVAAAILGSDERMEYSLVGDTVNLSQRLQELAGPGETVLSEATYQAVGAPQAFKPLGPVSVKGRHQPVSAFRISNLQPSRSGQP